MMKRDKETKIRRKKLPRVKNQSLKVKIQNPLPVNRTLDRNLNAKINDLLMIRINSIFNHLIFILATFYNNAIKIGNFPFTNHNKRTRLFSKF